MIRIIKKCFCIFIVLQLISQISAFKEWWENTKVPLLNITNFYEIVGGEKYVVVNFFTRWCIYCRAMTEEYEKFYESYLQKRKDVIVTKIECIVNAKICSDYGVFAFPFIVLFFPGDKKMKSLFKNRRTADSLENWVDAEAPKKNLKPVKVNQKIEKINENNDNMTKIEDYITRQFTDIKKEINDINKYIEKVSNNDTKHIIEDYDQYEDNDDVIEIKITPFFILKCIGLFLGLRVVWHFIKNNIFIHSPLPKDIHQKN